MGMGKGKMEAAKHHYDMLMEALAALGMSLAEFEDQVEGEKAGEEEGGDYEEPSGEENGEEEMPMKKPLDKAKVAVIVARMKNKMKG